MKIVLVLLFFINSSTLFARDCILNIETKDNKLINPETLKEKIVLSLKSGDRYGFKLKKTDIECDVHFFETKNNTLINCWNPDYSIGMQSPSELWVSTLSSRNIIKFNCK